MTKLNRLFPKAHQLLVHKFSTKIVNYRNSSQEFCARSRFNRQTQLFDITTDYEQQHPLEDEAHEAEYIEKLHACMALHDSPEEQYERLSI